VDAVTGHFVLRVSAFTRTVTRLETDASGCASILENDLLANVINVSSVFKKHLKTCLFLH